MDLVPGTQLVVSRSVGHPGRTPSTPYQDPSEIFYIENLYETLCMVFMRDRADRAVLDTAWYNSSIIFHINWIPCLPPLAPRVGVVAPEHSDRNFV